MTTLSYAGQKNKWDTAADVIKVVDDIKNIKSLKCLVLEGNTLGIEAAREIGEALKLQPDFERAHFNNLFTGRLKNEVPPAIKLLFDGIQYAGAKLKEIDLSDNALGSIGVESFAGYLKASGHSLEELRLNNNGLGIRGGTVLAQSLIELHANCEAAGSPLQLKVLIAGRNRLENEGAKILAEFFAKVQSLEELWMPQNGIFHSGITALMKALSKNLKLRSLNLNDNTLTYKGGKALANHLTTIPNLNYLNLGDCLLKTIGAIEVATCIKDNHPNLKELHLDGNEINLDGGLYIIDCVVNKLSFTLLNLNGNEFGEEGCNEIRLKLKDLDKESILDSLEDDAEPDSDEEEEVGDEEEEDDDEYESYEDEDCEESVLNITAPPVVTKTPKECSIDQFIIETTAENLLGVRDPPLQTALVEAAKRRSEGADRDDSQGDSGSKEALINEYIFLFFKCASLITNNDPKVVNIVECCVKELAKRAFASATDHRLETIVTNNLLIHMGLMKTENKKFKITWNLKGGLIALNLILFEAFFLVDTKKSLQIFFSKSCPTIDHFTEQKHVVMKQLFA